MKIFNHFKDFRCAANDLALTIGNFDGIHLGHQAILTNLSSFTSKAVLTFSNHPATVLQQSAPAQLISLEKKIYFFEKAGIDYLFLIPFTKEFANQTAEEFLRKLKQLLNLKHLILGHDAVIGSQRKGNRELLSQIAQQLEFDLTYISPITIHELPVSSSLIRSYIAEGKLKEAESFLGRPYSISGIVLKGEGKGKAIGFPTLNIEVKQFALPPLGVYEVKVNNQYIGIANLGKAPSVKNLTHPLLEIHLPHCQIDMYGKSIEACFIRFLREEKKFSTIEELKKQIQLDIKKLIF